MSERMLRVNSILQHILAEEIERLSDSRLEMVSVTGVDASANLRHAVVYVDVLDEKSHDDALAALSKASKRLQAAIGRQVRMKYTPTLEFAIDPAVVGGERIDAILRGLQREGEEE